MAMELLYGIGALVLLGALAYAVLNNRRSVWEKRQADEATKANYVAEERERQIKEAQKL